MATSETDGDRFARIERLFHAALGIDPGRRADFLREQTGGDERLVAEVSALLDADGAGAAIARDPLAPLPEAMRSDAAIDAGATTSDRGASAAGDAMAGRTIGAWRIERLLGEGGMGRVWLATRADAAFEMKAAIKLLRSGRLDRHAAARFDRERRTLARLDHPGIARLLDGGEADDGTPWLAMELVDGDRIDLACDRRRATLDQRLASMIEVCAAVDHAHRRLIVHRDLKPSNVLVDAEGRTRLLDFGIARLIECDVESTSDGGVAMTSLTMPDERVLTPRYASPEQVRGEHVGIASDVYSLGVLLHELLCGRTPYPGDTGSRYAIEKAICESEPVRPSVAVADAEAAEAEAIAAARSSTPARLVAALRGDLDQIVQRCLQKDPERRYSSAAALADDLERHRRGLPVVARGDALAYRAAKFVKRNPVASVATVLLALAVAAGLGVHFEAARRNSELLARILPLADLKFARDLRSEAASLWPMRPDREAALRDWLARARELLARRPIHERGRASVAGLDLDDDQKRWLSDAIDEVLAEFALLTADDPFGDTIPGVERRLAAAASLRATSLEGEPGTGWQSAIVEIADPSLCPRYAGLHLAPQLGLVPLGRDPASGLHEFWHVQSGTRPARKADGSLAIEYSDGIVLVLLPGGEAIHGAQSGDAALPRFDPDAKSEEGPPRAVRIAPFFIGKHEVTQPQWLRITGTKPSSYPPGSTFGAQKITPLSPVEQVNQIDAARGLARVDLVLPSEEQWEYACRAGTEGPFFTGKDGASLAGAANFADRFARENGGAVNWQYSDAVDDGATVHAAVGSYRANPFGLHDVHGNVWEWCADAIVAKDNKDGVARGGGFFNPPAMLRSSCRYFVTRDFRSHSLGLRAARAVE